MTEPNSTLRAVRMGMLMSQDDLARAIREAGARLGTPNDCSKRMIQRWEAGTIASPRPVYARALEAATGLPIASLGFRPAVPFARVDGEPGAPGAIPAATPVGQPRAANFSGIWLSRYEYPSSSRGESYVGEHYALVLQHGDRLTVRSLPESADGELTMDLTVDGTVVTGSWHEVTAKAGYYRGAKYHGAIQLVADPTGRRMSGQWVGFGRDGEVNVGPWTLTFEDASTSTKTLEAFNRRPNG